MGFTINTLEDAPPPRLATQGFTIIRRAAPLESVQSKASHCQLLGSYADYEVIKIDLDQDAHFGVTPSGESLQMVYVISGQLSDEASPMILEASMTLSAEGIVEPTLFRALTDVSLLYITTEHEFHTLSEHLSQLRDLAIQVELKDGYTADHCDRLQTLSVTTGKTLGLSAAQLIALDHGAYLHDVGKIHVPLEILNKPGKLTPEEWDVIKKHPTFGRELLDQTFMKEAGKIVEQHHERTDGSGYPFGLRGSEIMIEASIVAVADTYDAMTTDRPYRKALSEAEALAELNKYAGVHYPEEVVRAFEVALSTLVPEAMR